VPEHVAEAEQAAAIVARQHLVVAAEIGDVGDLGRQPALLLPVDPVRSRVFERPEMAAERQLLLVVDLLVPKHHHRKAVHALDNRGDLVRTDRPRQVDTVHDTGEIG
jgi:hypothetical protein